MLKTLRKISIALALCSIFLIPGKVDAAKLYLFPASETIYEGQSFMAEVRLDTEGERINAAKIGIEVDKNIFQLEEFNNAGGIFTFYPEGPNLENGNITFQAAVPNGYEGSGVVGRLFLRAKTNVGPSDGLTAGTVEFSADSEILLDDGEATPALLKRVTGTYTITERPDNLPIITSESHPSENEWQKGPFIRLDWDVKEGAYYSYKLTRNPNEGLDDSPNEPVGDIKLTTNEDGIFYFMLKECTEEGCGPVAKYRIFKDSTPPKNLEIKLGQDTEAYGGEKFLTFFAEDDASGISHYEVNDPSTYSGQGTGEWEVARSPYVLKNQEDPRKIQVKAVDRAGNTKIEVYEPEKVIHKFNYILTAIIIIGILLFIFVLKNITAKRKDKLQNHNAK